MQRPVAVHRDGTIYLFERDDSDGQIGQKLVQFAELVKAPEGIHTFRLTPYSLWSGAARQIPAENIINFLESNSINQIPNSLKRKIKTTMTTFNTIELRRQETTLILEAKHRLVMARILSNKKIADMVKCKPDTVTLHFDIDKRIELKKHLSKKGLFAKDASNVAGEHLDINLRMGTLENDPFSLRDYQKEAATAFLRYNDFAGGGGLIIMPPGTGKTLVGLAIMSQVKTSTLIIVDKPSTIDLWKTEIADKTDLSVKNVSAYSDTEATVQPVTIATYQQLATKSAFAKEVLSAKWGLVIYDDAHKIPAETYVETTDIESQFKLALASTLARSDQKGTEIYSLIGPKWYEILPRTLESRRFLRPVRYFEIRIPLENGEHISRHRTANDARQRRIAAFNSLKFRALDKLLEWDKNIVIVTYYRNLAKSIAEKYQIPLLNTTKHPRRDQLIEHFNQAIGSRLVITSVLESLPVKNMDIILAVSYNKGSEREEYLRLGKVAAYQSGETGYFVSLVSANTIEETDYKKRRRSLINCGYRYKIMHFQDFIKEGITAEPATGASQKK